MKKFALMVTCFIICSGCNTKELNQETLKINKLSVINKTSSDYGGEKSVRIDNPKKLQKITFLLNSLKENIKRPRVNLNKGFLEIVEISNQKELFTIVFSVVDGKLVHYNNEFYRSKELVDLLCKELKMDC